uniref:ATP synthase F0 subunit 6 n=1 Tax=Taiwanaptera montana TaxID=3135762 RepID=UPI0031F3E826
MMTNLFSSFDPATSMKTSMNWVSTVIIIMMLPMPYWLPLNNTQILFYKILLTMNKEFKLLTGQNSSPLTMLFVSLFTFILMNNLLGLLPYVFTGSSHITFTLAMALPLWLSLMMYGWINNTNHMFSHLIPMGTPALLMPFMVCIETISNLIRPGSLAVRLTANMIAGHLLMTLLGNNSISSEMTIKPLILSVQMMLMWFEMAVAIIQAYVFSVLSSLYSSEVK